MNPRIRRWLDWFALAVILFWAVAIAVESRREQSSRNVFATSVLFIGSPLIRFSHGLRQACESVAMNQFEGRKLRVENVQLRRQNQQLQLEMAKMRDDNARLKRLTGGVETKSLQEKYRLVLAEVIGRGREASGESLLISRGERDGIQTGMPVVRGDALVGVIRQTQSKSAYVQLLTDPNSLVGCAIETTRESGIVRGLGKNNFSKSKEYLEFLPDVQTAQIPPKAALVTSGLSGSLFPGGLRIGEIDYSEPNEYGQRVGLVKPSVDFSAIEEIVVLAQPLSAPAPKPAVPQP